MPLYILFRSALLVTMLETGGGIATPGQIIWQAINMALPIGIFAAFCSVMLPNGAWWRVLALVGIPTVLGPMAMIFRFVATAPQMVSDVMGTVHIFALTWFAISAATYLGSTVIVKFWESRHTMAIA